MIWLLLHLSSGVGDGNLWTDPPVAPSVDGNLYTDAPTPGAPGGNLWDPPVVPEPDGGLWG